MPAYVADAMSRSTDAKVIKFTTAHLFGELTVIRRDSSRGPFIAYVYPISDSVNGFVVETDEETWLKAELDDFDVDQPAGPSDEYTQLVLEELFADDLAGADLVGDNSRWTTLPTTGNPSGGDAHA